MNSAAETRPSPINPTLDGRTVLVIEDHRDSRELLTQVLQSLRAHVITASTVEQAERTLAFHRPHLVICDMKLPDGTGHDFVKWLRQQSRTVAKIPCIAITGFEQAFPANAAHGFDAYMRKPIDIDRFCTAAVALARR